MGPIDRRPRYMGRIGVGVNAAPAVDRRDEREGDQIMDRQPTRVSSSEDHWVIDKKIPLAQIISFAVVVIVQSAIAVWWLSAQSARLDDLTRRMQQQESIKTAERLTTLEALLPRVESQLNRIEQKVDQIRKDQ